ncbi:hypothetical protein [Hyphomonas sp.]|jgi:hypothetical protein|uniref:hypothetical protein n=1 Tax=Hyphomonas sp. TaxID=87 RepID=UPI0032D936D8|tara:strand:- start:16721 stop:17044 length:324 start_codon:yes stop_codon:yes gene_type:complete
MSSTQIILLFLGTPFMAGVLAPFFRGRWLVQFAVWAIALLSTLVVVYVWAGMEAARLELTSIRLALAASALWSTAGLAGLLVGREAENVRRDARNTREKRKASEIFR